MSPGGWEAVAAEGTDPALLQRVAARLVGGDGAPQRIARDAVRLRFPSLLDEGGTGGGTEGGGAPRAVLERLAPRPSGQVRGAAAAVAAAWADLGVRAALVGDPAYPARLAAGWPETAGPPLLAWRGPAGGLPAGPAVAVVGARRASSYGTAVAAWLAEAAAAAGVLVVSGGAVGVDAAAHRGALGWGRTAVVLGCGHAVAYPRAHARPGGLFDQVLDDGGWLVSELPPLAPPRPVNVVARNRIVAGLVDAVVVVEGGRRSGALRTAEVAAERGVAVLAVPGDVRAPGSAAPHRLLSEGAAPCTGPDDLLAAVRADAPPPEDPLGEAAGVLPAAVRAVLAHRWPRPVGVDDLAEASGVPAGALLAALTRARICGEVAESAEGVRLRRAPQGRGRPRPGR